MHGNNESPYGAEIWPPMATDPITDGDITAAGCDAADPHTRRLADHINIYTGSKEFALQLVAGMQQRRGKKPGSTTAVAGVVRCAIDNNISRSAKIDVALGTSGQATELISLLEFIFHENDVNAEWDKEVERRAQAAAREERERAEAERKAEFIQTVSPQTSSKFAETLWAYHDVEDKPNAFDGSNPKMRAERAVQQLVGIAYRHLDKETVCGVLETHFGKYIDVKKAWADVVYDIEEKRRDKALESIKASLGNAAATAIDEGCSLDSYLEYECSEPSTLWGIGKEILWASGEALIICADIGCGKTTLAGLLSRALLKGGDVLGHPVQSLRDNPRILYLALDRPKQIGRSLDRQFTLELRGELGDRFTFLPGPLPIDASENPRALVQIADLYQADIVIVDSLKDIALGLAEDRAAANYNRARGLLLSSGRELIELHHLTKKGDLFGAKWLDAGVGSALRISGKPGCATSTVTQLKPVAHLVPPVKIAHDRDHGEMAVIAKESAAVEAPATAAPDLARWVAGHGEEGVTANQAAMHLRGADDRPAVLRAKRELSALADAGRLRVVEGSAGRGNPTRWFGLPE